MKTATLDETAHRPRCSVYVAVSVDGYIARPGGGIDWLSIVELEGEDYGYKVFLDSIDVLVVGRKTYDVALGFAGWPYVGKRCVVLTHRPPLASRHGEEFFAGVPRAVVERLAREGARRVYVDGGAVIQQFLSARLIDDLTLSVVPVVLGGGVRLFADDAAERRLILDDAKSWPSGLAQLRYRMA